MENIKYQTLIQCFLFSLIFSAPIGFAQDSDQSSADSGVLISSPNHTRVVGQDSAVENADNDVSSQDTSQKSSDSTSSDELNPPTDEIIVKATDAVMFQMTANLRLTQDQINSVRPIITDNIIKVRKLQQSLQDGTIDSKAMYDQRLQLTEDEDRQLSHILTADQLKIWVNIQGQ